MLTNKSDLSVKKMSEPTSSNTSINSSTIASSDALETDDLNSKDKVESENSTQETGFKNQANKDMQHVTDDYAETEGVDDEKLSSAMSKLHVSGSQQDSELKKQKERELAKVNIAKADIEFVVQELDLPKYKAEELLREHRGDLLKSLKAFIEAN